MTSDTPRTDRVARGRTEIASPTVVDVEFARALERELAAAQAEIAALREDAERYRWITRYNNPPLDAPGVFQDTGYGEGFPRLWGDKADAAIDAARAKS